MNESYTNRAKIVRDQAESLRRARQTNGKPKMNGITRVMSFTSGKGGVGKTFSAVNLAVALAKLGKSVLILDADLGLANIDVMFGLRPRYTLQHVLEGAKSLQEIIVDGPCGISVIPAASGVEALSNLDSEQRLNLMEAVEGVAHSYEYLLIDTQAGIGADVMYFNSASSEVVCIVNPQPTSLTDTYALIKILSRQYGERKVSVIVNNAKDKVEAKLTFTKLARAVDKFLQIDLQMLGFVPTDSNVVEAIQLQRPMVELFPTSPASLAISGLARQIDSEFPDRVVKGGMQFFFRQLLESNVNGL